MSFVNDPSESRGASSFSFEEVFDADEYLHFYEETLAAEDTGAQVDALLALTGLAPPARLLDLGCGHGRHALELARRGFEVDGVDLVPAFVERARAAASELGVGARFEVGDMRAPPFEPGYAGAHCLFDAFGLLDDVGNLEVLRAARAMLADGGAFVLDVRNRDWVVRSMAPTTVLEKGDDLMIDRHAFDSATGRLVDRRALVRGGRVRKVTFSVRLYAPSELSLLLELAGFGVERMLGGWAGEPVSLSRNRLVAVARAR